jgi:hypothetical protein
MYFEPIAAPELDDCGGAAVARFLRPTRFFLFARLVLPPYNFNTDRVVANGAWRLCIPDNGESWIACSGQPRLTLDSMHSYYCRIIDLSTVQQDKGFAARWRGLVRRFTLGSSIFQASLSIVQGSTRTTSLSRCTKPRSDHADLMFHPASRAATVSAFATKLGPNSCQARLGRACD